VAAGAEGPAPRRDTVDLPRATMDPRLQVATAMTLSTYPARIRTLRV